MSRNIQAPDTFITVPGFLHQCHVYSFNACCSVKNSRSSDAMLQIGLNIRDGTHHNPFSLLLFFSYFFPSDFAPRKGNAACPTPLMYLLLNLSNTLTEVASILSTRRTPLVPYLRS